MEYGQTGRQTDGQVQYREDCIIKWFTLFIDNSYYSIVSGKDEKLNGPRVYGCGRHPS